MRGAVGNDAARGTRAAEKEHAMSRIVLTDGSGRWFDDAKAKVAMTTPFRLAMVLAVVLMAGCSGSSDRASLSSSPKDGAADSTSTSSPPSALPLAEQLLTHPTAALVKQAGADHVLTANDQALVAVYWAFLANAYTRGTFDPVFLQSGIQDAVLELASKYPSFFQVSDGGRISYVQNGIVIGQTTFTCAQGCAPSAATLFTVGTEGKSAITGILGAVTKESQALGALFNTASLLLASRSLSAALAILGTVNADQVLAVVVAVATTVASFVALLPEEAGLAAVLAIYGETIFTVDLGRLLSALDACTAWQTAHTCGSKCYDIDCTCVDQAYPLGAVCCPAGEEGHACGSVCCAYACADPLFSMCGGCDATSCSNCCDSNGVCQPGISNAACGSGGQACAACIIPTTCQAVFEEDGGVPQYGIVFGLYECVADGGGGVAGEPDGGQ